MPQLRHELLPLLQEKGLFLRNFDQPCQLSFPFEDCQKFEKAVKDYSQRTIAKPGITGLAQFTEYRGDFEWNCVESRVDKDLDYIRRWSILLDLSLIFKTAAVIVAKTLGLSPAIPSPTRADTIIPIPSLVNSNVNSEQNQRDEHERRAA